MKKNLKGLLLVLFLMLGISIESKEINAQTVTDSFNRTFIGTYHYVFDDGKFGDFELFTRNSDGSRAYCIQPGTSFKGGNYIGYTNLTNDQKASYVGLTSNQLREVSLIAQFGYGYIGHNTNEWYVATQALIWSKLGKSYQFTSRNSAANPWAYVIATPNTIQAKMNEIESLVANYKRTPAFNATYATINVGDSYSFVDYAGLLSNYQVSSCVNCNASISGNNLVVTPTSIESGTITLESKRGTWTEEFIVYSSPTSQNIMVPGIVDPLKVNLSFDVVAGELQLKKYDAKTKTCDKSLKNTIYKLYKNDGTYIQDLIIDENCSASAKNLALGSYYVQEYSVNGNFELDSTKHFFDITKSQTKKELIVYDSPFLGQVEIYKFDSITNSCVSSGSASLKGTVYGIYKSDGTLISQLVIDENCYAKSEKNLRTGDYYIQEIKSGTGYKIDNKKYDFSITPENYKKVFTFQLKDIPYTTFLTINKTYLSQNGVQAEVGATFEVWSTTKNKKVATLVIDKSATASILLPYDKYIIKQVLGKEGYKLANDIDFSVNEETEPETYITLTNEPYSAKIKVEKVDTNNNKIALAGIKFKIYDIDNGKYVCQNITYPNVEEICEFETDMNGEFITPDILYPGHYRLEEVDQSIYGYLWNQNGLEFTIDENSNIIEDKDLGTLVVLTFENQEVFGEIQIHKVGEELVIENNSYYYQETNLADVVFELYDENGNLIQKIKTDENGLGTFKNLKLGKYILKEVSTRDGYVLSNEEYEIVLEYQDQYTPIVYKTFELKNYLKKGTLEFTKTDLVDDEPLPNTTIKIYDESTNVLIFEGKTDKDGKITISNLYVGNFRIEESNAPAGYILNDEPMYFSIKENGKIEKVNMTNEKIKGILKLLKTDELGNPLSGVKINIYKEDGGLYGTFITNEEGLITIENIEYGNYEIKEIKTLDGYEISSESLYFSIDSQDELVELSLVNKKLPQTGKYDYSKILGCTFLFAGGLLTIAYIKKQKKKEGK